MDTNATVDNQDPLYGGVEAGGTKFICGVGNVLTGSRESAVLPTSDPRTTLAAVQAFFDDAQVRHGRIAALGVGSFGPLQLDPRAKNHGFILTTPKQGWANTDVLGMLTRGLAVPGAIDTDVNSAAMAEASLLAHAADSLAYVTVGTGIGVGLWVNGSTVRGLGHPELGHLSLRRHSKHGAFQGICPFHQDCLEGLASGPALLAAWGAPLSELDPHHLAWEVEADYIGQLCAALILAVAPGRIVLGGGVMSQHRLFADIQQRTARWLGGYVSSYSADGALAQRIVPPGCHEPSGLIGAYMLAQRAARDA